MLQGLGIILFILALAGFAAGGYSRAKKHHERRRAQEYQQPHQHEYPHHQQQPPQPDHPQGSPSQPPVQNQEFPQQHGESPSPPQESQTPAARKKNRWKKLKKGKKLRNFLSKKGQDLNRSKHKIEKDIEEEKETLNPTSLELPEEVISLMKEVINTIKKLEEDIKKFDKLDAHLKKLDSKIGQKGGLTHIKAWQEEGRLIEQHLEGKTHFDIDTLHVQIDKVRNDIEQIKAKKSSQETSADAKLRKDLEKLNHILTDFEPRLEAIEQWWAKSI